MKRCSRPFRRRAETGPRALAASVFLCVLPISVGCVTKGTYDEVVTERNGLRAEKTRLDERVRMLEASARSLDSERVELIDKMEDLREQQAVLDENLRRLRKKEAELSDRVAVQEVELQSRGQEIDRLRGTYEGLVSDLEAELAAGQIEIEQLREGLQLNMAQEVLFASGSAEVSRGGQVVLGKVAERVRQVPYQVVVRGHTDDVPISTARFPSNWELAGARASRVVRILARQGVSGDRLAAVSFGEHSPRASNETSEGRAKNRRIEITLKPMDGESLVATPAGKGPEGAPAAPKAQQEVPAAAAP